MKKSKFIFLALLCSFPVNALAADFTTKDGYIIPEENYHNLQKLYTDESIYTMSQEKYNSIIDLDLNYDEVKTTTKYIYSVCDTIAKQCEDYEISEQEYNNSVYVPAPYLNSSYESNYKLLVMNLTKSSNQAAHFVLTNTWKTIPSTRSYDVIGVRLGNFNVINGSQSGKQIYTVNGQSSSINYAPNGTNINNFDNGFGISMNIVDSNITYLENTIDATLMINATPAVIYGSYQHSTSDISLSTSKNYTIGSGGLGSVFKFKGSSGDTYDGMMGVYDNILN